MTKPRLEFTVLKPTRIRYFFTSFVYHFSDKLFFRVTFCLPQTSETVAKTCSVKKMFLEISQNSQKNTCASFSFLIKLQALGMQLYQKRETGTAEHLRWLLLKLSIDKLNPHSSSYCLP